MTWTTKQPIPASSGVGFKHQHFDDIQASVRSVGWFEVHPENFMANGELGKGGEHHRQLHYIRQDYPISFHGVAMSLGSADGLDPRHLHQLKELIDVYDPSFISEHLAWSRWHNIYLNDLLPVPYTKTSLSVFEANIDHAQNYLKRPLLVENPSTYLTPIDQEYSEAEFIIELAKRTGVRLLLDVNNVYISASNHGFNADAYIQTIPKDIVAEIHLAGHAIETHGNETLRIDDHSCEVSETVWQLFQKAIKRFGNQPALIEWDTNVPDWKTLSHQAWIAQQYLNENIHERCYHDLA